MEKFYTYLSLPDCIRLLWVLFDSFLKLLRDGIRKSGRQDSYDTNPKLTTRKT